MCFDSISGRPAGGGGRLLRYLNDLKSFGLSARCPMANDNWLGPTSRYSLTYSARFGMWMDGGSKSHYRVYLSVVRM